MNIEELGGVVRTLAAAGFGMLVGKGYMDSATATALAGAVGTIFVAVLSIRNKRLRAR